MIKFANVKQVYEVDGRDEIVALRDFDVTIQDHEFVSIVGPSGCGKTTALKLAAGLLLPSAGKVTIDGEEVVGPGPDRAVVFQDVRLLPWMDIEGNVGYGLRLRGMPKAQRMLRAREELGRVELQAFAKQYPRQLSGGMAQRVGLARALAVEPDTLLMDEPFGALDALTRQTLQEDLVRICEETRKTVLFITHSIEEAVLLSDRVAVMSAHPGRVLDIISIDLPRPRDESVRATPSFHSLVQRIWKMLSQEVRITEGLDV